MATKKFGVASPFLNNRTTQSHLTRTAALDAASLAARNQAKETARVNTLRNANFKGDPYSYGYGSGQVFYDESSTPLAPLSEVTRSTTPITNNPVTINNVAKVGADDITQYLSGAFKSIEPQYGEVAPNRMLNRNSIEGYSIKFGKGGVAKKAIAEIEGILSRLPKGSAASQAKVASELEQAAADKAALYTAAPISNKTGKDAIAQAKKTLAPKDNKDKFLEPSKVKQRLYHGTGSDISEFRPNSFFSDDPRIAEMYAKSQHRAVEGSGPNIIPVDVQFENPYFHDENEARKQGKNFSQIIAPTASAKGRLQEALRILREKGHDSVILQNFDDIGGRQNQYIALDPSKVKSAIGNRGTYDINEADITKARGGLARLAKGGQAFPLQKPLDDADLAPTEVNPIAGMASRGLANVHDFLVKPFGYENPPMEVATDFVGMPSWIKVLENKAYGTPSYSGSGQAIRLNEEAIDPLLSVVGGAKPAAKALTKVTKKVAKEAAPYAANQAVNLMEKYGVSPTMNVVKPKGGNWIYSDNSTQGLRRTNVGGGDDLEETAQRLNERWTPQALEDLRAKSPDLAQNTENAINSNKRKISINKWINTKLNNYIKNEMATPEDPVRLGMERRFEEAQRIKEANDKKLANIKAVIDKRKAEGKDVTLSQRDYEAAKEKADEENLFANKSITHMTAPFDYGWDAHNEGMSLPRDELLKQKRANAGFPREGMTKGHHASTLWEMLSDEAVKNNPASLFVDEVLNKESRNKGIQTVIDHNSWIAKVAEKDPNTPIYYVSSTDVSHDLEFRHMVDELQEALNPNSVLPQNLKITEKDLEKMTVDDVSALSGKISAWRDIQKVKADKDIANNPATHTFKEYTENNPKGLSWKQIKRPEGYSPEEQEKYVRAATQYEGDVMRHCVGGSGHCDPLLDGEVEIYTLRDAKGEPHVTIEVSAKPDPRAKGNTPKDFYLSLPMEEMAKVPPMPRVTNSTDMEQVQWNRKIAQSAQYRDWLSTRPKNIEEIKGKGNKKPNDEYLPFVQDFIRSGQWGAIADISNTGLRSSRSVLGEGVVKALRDRGEYVPPVMGFDEAVKFQEMHNPNAFKDITTVEDYRKTWDRGGVGDGYAEGGEVNAGNDLMALVDEQFLNQPIEFGKGGIAKKIADKFAKSLESQLDESVHNLLDQHIVEKIKPKAAPKDKFLPVNLPRTRRTDQQIDEHAQRVARQLMGEHVRDPKNPKDATNAAGRSMREVERLKNIDYTLEKTKDLPEPQIVDPQIGDVNILTVGDITVADRNLVDVNGYPIHSTQEGGPFFGKGKLHLPDDESLWWASEESSAQNYQNRVDEIAEHYGLDKLKAHHLAMGQQANNFAMHFADANLKAINTYGVPEEGIGAINSTVRNGFSIIKDGERIDFKFPDFPGVENLDDAYKYFREKPEARKWFNNRMKTPTLTQQYGLPNGLDIQWAITDPVLRNMEINLTGRSVGDVYKGAKLTDTADHGTYGKGIRGKFQGTTQYPIPMELSHSDAYDYTAARKNKAHITGTLQKVAPHQVVDQQYLDEIGKYNDLIKKYTGKRKGGKMTAKDRVERKMYDIDASEPNRMGVAPYGLRYALSASEVPEAKGKGYFGEMRGAEDAVTEYALDDMDLGSYPSVTPNQPNENLDEIKRGKVSHSTYQLARKYAAMRKNAGKSAFAQMDELRYPQPQD